MAALRSVLGAGRTIGTAPTLGWTVSQPARHMATLQDLSIRLKSVKNIQKITSSMKMVAAAKLRGAERSMMSARSFGEGSESVFEHIAAEREEGAPEPETQIILGITSDKGLCGGVNSVIAKEVRRMVEEKVKEGVTPKVMLIGDKGRAALFRDKRDYFARTVTGLGKAPNYSQCLAIADEILTSYPDYDTLTIVYNKFVNKIKYDTDGRDVVSPKAIAESPAPSVAAFENEAEEIRPIQEMHLATVIYDCMMDAITSEQSARMSAMENASKNAGEMIDALTLKYNRQRQAVITTELIEIISGASSLE